MMHPVRTTLRWTTVVLACAALPHLARAQESEGLEETYARLCGKGQKSEVCAVLRQALRKKLEAEDGGTTSTAAAKTAAALPASAEDDSLARRWGILARMAGHRYHHASKDVNVVVDFSWVEKGKVLRSASRSLGVAVDMPPSDYHWDDTKNEIVIANMPAGSAATVAVEPDGSIRMRSTFSTITSDSRLFLRPDGSLGMSSVTKDNGKDIGTTELGYALADGVDDATLKARTADGSGGVTVAAASEGALSGIERFSDPAIAEGGGSMSAKSLLKGAAGAAAGLAVAKSVGANGEQTAGLMMKGAAAATSEGTTTPAPAATTAGAEAPAKPASSPAPGAPAAGSGPTGIPGTYPTKPNVLAGEKACAMMNETNYRQVALAGGDDVQLKTMCGQAYEYYVAYKRAIAQGYSEADANRTYDAHEKSARVAINFYASSR